MSRSEQPLPQRTDSVTASLDHVIAAIRESTGANLFGLLLLLLGLFATFSILLPGTFLQSGTTKTANDVSPDGRYLLYREFSPATLGDLKVVPLTGDRQPRIYVATADDESNGDFSPDGRWVAYASDESGRKEIYAASFPDPARRFRGSDGRAPVSAAVERRGRQDDSVATHAESSHSA